MINASPDLYTLSLSLYLTEYCLCIYLSPIISIPFWDRHTRSKNYFFKKNSKREAIWAKYCLHREVPLTLVPWLISPLDSLLPVPIAAHLIKWPIFKVLTSDWDQPHGNHTLPFVSRRGNDKLELFLFHCYSACLLLVFCSVLTSKICSTQF